MSLLLAEALEARLLLSGVDTPFLSSVSKSAVSPGPGPQIIVPALIRTQVAGPSIITNGRDFGSVHTASTRTFKLHDDGKSLLVRSSATTPVFDFPTDLNADFSNLEATTVSHQVLSGFTGGLQHLSVSVEMANEEDLFMSLTLTSPGATSVQLVKDLEIATLPVSGLIGATTFDDAGNPFANGGKLIAPADPLSAFNGEDPNGTWTLTVKGGQGGQLLNWSLTPSATIANRVVLSGTDAKDFTVVRQPDDPVAGGVSQSFDLAFAPRSAGTKTATVSVHDAAGHTSRFQVKGVGVAHPSLKLTGPINLPDTGKAVTHTLTITNTGVGVLHLKGIANIVETTPHQRVDLFVSRQPTKRILSRGASTTLDVTYNPDFPPLTTVSRHDRGVIRIASDDPDHPLALFPIVGDLAVGGGGGSTDIGPGSPILVGVGSASSISMIVIGNGTQVANGQKRPRVQDGTEFFSGFDVMLSQPQDQVFTIVNPSAGALRLGSNPRVKVRGASAADFRIVSRPPSAINGAADFTVRFTPRAVGPRRATISIRNDAALGRPFTFSILGMGAAN